MLIGQSISHYRILEKLGEGGMGEVYLAQDTGPLDRKVALKFLPQDMQQDPEARKRFLREAQSAAALDHPFVCHIHEVGEVEGKDFIAMEYVQGVTLEEKLAKGPLPLQEALQIAAKIAESIEAAHKQEIVHRDLKPSNIMITPEGHLKVMDFGLAKRLTPAEGLEGQEKTASRKLTATGTTLGTLPYMSPEQSRGEEVDTRSDIFSFGVVLYEMLTGVQPFLKDSPVETAHAILNEAPAPVSTYLDQAPVLLPHTVRKMLAKEPGRRYQHVEDIRIDLEELISGTAESGVEIQGAVPTSPASYMRRILPWLLVGILIVALTLALIDSGEAPEGMGTVRFPIFPPETVSIIDYSSISISPDGKQIVFSAADEAGKGSLWVRRMDSEIVQRLDGTDQATDPFWSPDSRFIGFFADAKLRKIDLSGGPAVTLAEAPRSLAARGESR